MELLAAGPDVDIAAVDDSPYAVEIDDADEAPAPAPRTGRGQRRLAE